VQKNKTPELLAQEIASRSNCRVQVGAVIYDSKGIISWGWNHIGTGTGQHAEAFALSRANRKRLDRSSIAVFGIQKRNGIWVFSKPCKRCMQSLQSCGIKTIVYSTKEYQFKKERI
jgi:deoxycytidylate deaminase